MGVKKHIIHMVIICLFSFFSLQAVADNIPDPTEQFRPFVDKVTEILSNRKANEDPRCELCQRIIDVARDHFDFEEMSKRTLGSHWKKLNQKERESFVDLFTRLLQHAYIGKVKDYADQEVEFVNQRIKGNRAEIQTLLIESSKTIPVSYILLLRENKWLAYDVVIEGVSLVRNYMEQFREILRKEEYAGLVRQLEEKIKQLEEENSNTAS